MRNALVSSLAVLAVACGGNVVVDNKSLGTGGSGGESTTSGTTSVTATTGTNCQTSTCSVGSDGSCSCTMLCEEQNRVVECKPTPIGASCTCILNDIKIANCSETVPTGCDILGGCCADAYFGGQ